MAIDIIWKDRKLANPRKIKLKNIETDEIIDYEIQDDSENILEESDTPINATTLNLMTNAINNQMNNFDNFTQNINEELNEFKNNKIQELNIWEEEFKSNFQNELLNLSGNFIQINETEEWEIIEL